MKVFRGPRTYLPHVNNLEKQFEGPRSREKGMTPHNSLVLWALDLFCNPLQLRSRHGGVAWSHPYHTVVSQELCTGRTVLGTVGQVMPSFESTSSYGRGDRGDLRSKDVFFVVGTR